MPATLPAGSRIVFTPPDAPEPAATAAPAASSTPPANPTLPAGAKIISTPNASPTPATLPAGARIISQPDVPQSPTLPAGAKIISTPDQPAAPSLPMGARIIPPEQIAGEKADAEMAIAPGLDQAGKAAVLQKHVATSPATVQPTPLGPPQPLPPGVSPSLAAPMVASAQMPPAPMPQWQTPADVAADQQAEAQKQQYSQKYAAVNDYIERMPQFTETDPASQAVQRQYIQQNPLPHESLGGLGRFHQQELLSRLHQRTQGNLPELGWYKSAGQGVGLGLGGLASSAAGASEVANAISSNPIAGPLVRGLGLQPIPQQAIEQARNWAHQQQDKFILPNASAAGAAAQGIAEAATGLAPAVLAGPAAPAVFGIQGAGGQYEHARQWMIDHNVDPNSHQGQLVGEALIKGGIDAALALIPGGRGPRPQALPITKAVAAMAPKAFGKSAATLAGMEAGRQVVSAISRGENVDPAAVFRAGGEGLLYHAMTVATQHGFPVVAEKIKSFADGLKARGEAKPEQGAQAAPSEAEKKAAEYQGPVPTEKPAENIQENIPKPEEPKPPSSTAQALQPEPQVIPVSPEQQAKREAALAEIEAAGHRAPPTTHQPAVQPEQVRPQQGSGENQPQQLQQPAHGQSVAEPEQIPHPVFSHEEMRRMPMAALRRNAQQWGVQYESRAQAIRDITAKQGEWRQQPAEKPRSIFDEPVKGQPDALRQQRPAEQIPRPAGAGENLAGNGEGVRRDQQGNEITGAGEAQIEAAPKAAPQEPVAQASAAPVAEPLTTEIQPKGSQDVPEQTAEAVVPSEAGQRSAAGDGGKDVVAKEEGQKGQEEIKAPQAASVFDARPGPHDVDLRRAPMKELRQYARDKGIKDIPASRAGILAALKNEPAVDTPARAKATDTIAARRDELTNQLRDMIVKEHGPGIREISSEHPTAIQAMRGERGPGALISPEKAMVLAEATPEGYGPSIDQPDYKPNLEHVEHDPNWKYGPSMKEQGLFSSIAEREAILRAEKSDYFRDDPTGEKRAAMQRGVDADKAKLEAMRAGRAPNALSASDIEQDVPEAAATPKKYSEAWAKKKLAEKEARRQAVLKKLTPEQRRYRGSSILEPEDLFLHGLIAAHKIVAKVKDFAAWSKQMLEKFGDVIRPHLTTLWDQVRPRGEETATGIKNAQVDMERAMRGLPPAIGAAKRSFGDVWDAAMKEVEADPQAQDKLIKELRERPRALTDREDALLLHRQITLQNEFHKVAGELTEAHRKEDEAGIVSNRIRSAAVSDQLLDLYNIGKSSGTETGRGLNARKMMAAEDFTLAAMETRKRAANEGRELTAAEKTEIASLHERIKKAEAALAEHEQKAVEERAGKEFQHARAEIIAEVKQEARTDKAGGKTRDSAAERRNIAAGMRKQVDKGAVPTDLRGYIRALAKNFISEGIIERDPLLDAVHSEVSKIVPEMTRRQTMDAISGYGDFKTLSKDEIDVKLRDLKGQMQQVGKLEDMESGRAPLKTGVERRAVTDEERRLIQQVNETKKRLGIQTVDPETQLKSALDSIKTRLGNQIKDLELQISTGTKIVKGKSPTPRDAEAIALETRRNELKKQYDDLFGKTGISEEQRLKMATAAAEKSIAELERRIRDKDLFAGKKPAAVQSSFALTTLRTRQQAMRLELKELQDLDVAHQEGRKEAALQKSVADLEKKIAEGDASAPEKRATADTLQVAQLKQQRAALNKQLADARKNAAGGEPEEQRKQAAIAKSIEGIEAKIAAGDISTKPKAATVDSRETALLKARRAAVMKQLNDLRKAARPQKTPAEIAQQHLKATKTRLLHNIADLSEKIVAGDFETRQRRGVKLDDEGLRLKAENERLKDVFHRDLVRDQLKKRSWAEKAQDTFVKWRRGWVLSSPITLAKLISAAAERTVFTPTEEVVGYGFSKIVPGLARRAPREGGLSVRAEAKAITEGFTKGMIDSWQTLKTGKSDLDVVYGKDSGVPQQAIDFIGGIHGALKTVTKRNEFARSFQKRTEWAMRNGIDVTDPIVQSRMALDAYKDANRSIFLNDNRVVAAYKRGLTALEERSKTTGKRGGKMLATAAKTLLPIIKVPTNIVAETMQYATGSVTGSARLARAYAKGIESLHPDEADSIMRQLKKGSLGAAAMALGFFGADQIGGYYQPGQKRDRKDVKAGQVRVFGHDIPSYLVHNPFLEALQIGATVRRVADSKLKKSDTETQGLAAGAKAAAFGLIAEVPFVRETETVASIIDSRERDKTLGEIGSGIVVPQASQWLARQTDKNSQGEPTRRKPEGIVQNIEMGIPGLRQRVPREEIEKTTPADKAVEIYLSRDESERKALEPVVLKKVLGASHLNDWEQDKLLDEAGITPPPDLAITRELEHLNKLRQAYTLARRNAEDMRLRAEGHPDQAATLNKRADDLQDAARLDPEIADRHKQLTAARERIQLIRKQIEAGVIDEKEGQRRMQYWIREAKKAA